MLYGTTHNTIMSFILFIFPFQDILRCKIYYNFNLDFKNKSFGQLQKDEQWS